MFIDLILKAKATGLEYSVILSSIEYDRYGNTFMAEAQGPVISDINSIASIIAEAKAGKMTKAEEEALKLRINNIPGRNLFYLLPAITLYYPDG